MADAVWLTGLEVYTRTTYDWPRVVEVSVQQRWSGLKFVERTYPLMVLDPRTGDREDFAIGLFSLLNSEVLPGLFVDVDETTIEACARDFEAREMPEHAAACWGWLGNEQEFSRVERWLRTGGEPVVG
jgi:hypothetical protein